MAQLNIYRNRKYIQNKNQSPVIIDRKQQKRSWLFEFFNTTTMKILGICLFFIVVLAIMWAICKFTGDTTTASEIWEMMRILIPMIFGSMLSTISISIEIKKKSES
ncbi:MAG: hypothetical protein ACFFG0_38710 [Candidatus Thorarchaeota archaeon]